MGEAADNAANNAQALAATGPFGIVAKPDAKGNYWTWEYYVKPGANPTAEQYALAEKVGELANILRELPPSGPSLSLMGRLVGLFSATLVSAYPGDPKTLMAQVQSMEAEFFRRVAVPTYQRRLRAPVVTAVLIIIGLVVTHYLLPSIWDDLRTSLNRGPQLPPFSVVPSNFWLFLVGTLLGRLFFYARSYFVPITSMVQYFELELETSNWPAAILYDVMVGVVAYLFFVSGFIVIAFGGQDGAVEGASVAALVSTLQINQNALLALAFGALVGIIKTEVADRVISVARGGISRV